MKLVSFRRNDIASYGAVVDNRIQEVSDEFRKKYPDLRSYLSSAAASASHFNATTTVGFDEVEFLPVIPNHECKIIALGWSYASHQTETAHAKDEVPQLFLKHPQGLVGHMQPAIKPRVSNAYDYEGEFVIVIGKSGRAIPEASAMDHVAGYTILMDGSIRDFQKQSVFAGKNFDRASPYGPWIVTKDEIPDPHNLQLVTRLNGNIMQNENTGMLAWKIPYLISYCSTITTLQPGDAISTGTPGGVGSKRTPPVFLKDGDVLEIEIDRIGTLRNRIVAE